MTSQLAAQGFTAEEQMSMKFSLPHLAQSEQLDSCTAFGKVQTVGQHDYLIAVGFADSDLTPQKYFYSTDSGVTWSQLPPINDMKSVKALNRRFMGDPATVTQVNVDGQSQSVSEEARLSYVARAVFNDAAIIPKGAYITDSQGKGKKNSLFAGLTENELLQQTSYLNASQKQPVDGNVWSIRAQYDQVCLRSLQWPGYTAFYSPDTREYGGVYIGTGQRNVDLAFQVAA